MSTIDVTTQPKSSKSARMLPPDPRLQGTPLSSDELRRTEAYWRACNYLSLGMIYLQENPLLTEPLRPEHIKNRLLGHWGSSPGLSFIYVHLNRLIKKYDLDMIFLAGPGHGAPGVLGPAYLEGTTPRFIRRRVWMPRACGNSSTSSRFPAGLGAIARLKLRDPFMKEENSATCCPTPVARLSTTPS